MTLPAHPVNWLVCPLDASELRTILLGCRHGMSSDSESVIPSATVVMSCFRPSSEERDTLKRAVAKYAHEPIKSQLITRLESEDADYSPGNEEWSHLKFCIEQHHLHAMVEVRRDPNKKAAKLQLAKADVIARKFDPNFS